jgi:hypothetical protein
MHLLAILQEHVASILNCGPALGTYKDIARVLKCCYGNHQLVVLGYASACHSSGACCQYPKLWPSLRYIQGYCQSAERMLQRPPAGGALLITTQSQNPAKQWVFTRIWKGHPAFGPLIWGSPYNSQLSEEPGHETVPPHNWGEGPWWKL